MSDNIKNIGLAVGAVVVLVAAYLFFVAGGSEPAPTTLVTVPGATSTPLAVGAGSARTVVLIRTLRRTELDSEFMNSQAFEDLVDFSLVLNEQPIGRENPFAPIFFIFPEPLFINNTSEVRLDFSATESSTTGSADTSETDSSAGTGTTTERELAPPFLFGL